MWPFEEPPDCFRRGQTTEHPTGHDKGSEPTPLSAASTPSQEPAVWPGATPWLWVAFPFWSGLLAICIYSLKKCLFKSVAYFKTSGLLLLNSDTSARSGRESLFRNITCKYFLLFCSCLSTFFHMDSWRLRIQIYHPNQPKCPKQNPSPWALKAVQSYSTETPCGISAWGHKHNEPRQRRFHTRRQRLLKGLPARAQGAPRATCARGERWTQLSLVTLCNAAWFEVFVFCFFFSKCIFWNVSEKQ